jgi:hypothetical protein
MPGLGLPATLGSVGQASHNALGSDLSDRRRSHGFPQVRAGGAARRHFWLDDSEEVGLDKHSMDVDTAETLAGVVRLLRRAAVLAWAAADRAGAGSPGQLFALGLDLAADQARQLVSDGTEIEGPVPVGDEPAGLLRSAELLLRRVAPTAARDAFDDLRATMADLVWEANTGVGVRAARSLNSSTTATGWRARRCLTCPLTGRWEWCADGRN